MSCLPDDRSDAHGPEAVSQKNAPAREIAGALGFKRPRPEPETAPRAEAS
jgi:hypothetical protein